MDRNPVVAGEFYPNNEEELKSMLSKFIHEKQKINGLYGFLVPHAGYIYSGLIAGEAYSLLSNQNKFVILGPNHFGIGPRIATYPKGRWLTPLGYANVDPLVESLGIPISEYAFQFEHSIEVQIPFIQYKVKEFTFIPIILQELSKQEYYKMAEIVENLINKGYFFIVSSDLNHYLENEVAHKKDNDLINSFINDSFEEFLKKAYDMSACGFMAMAIAILVKNKLKGKFSLIDYKTSGDITGEKEKVVGYASIAFST